ncbi:MAG: hypothetical protein ABSG80_09665 [Verrucomicrobiota bacterium]|jgi:hypothetical protein
MKPSELFGVVVRMIGFLVILYGLWNVWAGFENIFENILPMNESSDADLPSSLSYFTFGVLALVVGAVCFFLADWIVKLAYRDSSQ